MAQSTKVHGSIHFQMQLKSPAEKFYGVFQNQCELFPTIMPQDIRNVEKINAGVWLWTFDDGDKCGSWEAAVGPVDNVTKKSVTWTLQDGEVPKKLYTSLKVVFKFHPTGEGCQAEGTLIYEKKYEGAPDPKAYKDFIIRMLEAVDQYLPK